ncbi:hypothetical protein ACJMK2_019574 [Sinanodonta woodiana]|uniref:Uncharacterized protein n=1 Tax=Sinanodonta woodiana TaxID=1069815 RepID=A0ABD3TX71_SINWO
METIEKHLLDHDHKSKTELQQIFEPEKLNEQQTVELLPVVAETSSTANSSFEVNANILLFDGIGNAEFNDSSFIISEEERIEWDKMIKEKQDELVKQKEKFERWEEEMTKRKIFVLRKLKKLNSYRSKRMQFYTWINGFVSSTEQN